MPTAPPVHKPFGKAKRQATSRKGSTARGYDYRWQQARERYLLRFPLCASCEANGGVVVATDVDHVVPHRGDAALFWDETNWQGLCKRCHSRKTGGGR